MTPNASSALRRAILGWYRTHGRDLPWRHTRDGYRILVSEIMLQQTQVERVVPAYRRFLRHFPSARALARARLGDVVRAWMGLGYNGRARRLWLAAHEIGKPRGVRLSADPTAMRALPGVGRYTAAAVAAFAFDARTPVVDTNVRRVLSRIMDGVADAGEARAWELAARILPRARSARWHHALMDVGALFCRAVPACDACPARAHCRFARSGAADALRRSPRTASRPRQSPYVGSRRYFRGRILETLARSRSTNFVALGEQVRPGFEESDVPWLLDLLEPLRDEGMIVLDRRARRACLP